MFLPWDINCNEHYHNKFNEYLHNRNRQIIPDKAANKRKYIYVTDLQNKMKDRYLFNFKK